MYHHDVVARFLDELIKKDEIEEIDNSFPHMLLRNLPPAHKQAEGFQYHHLQEKVLQYWEGCLWGANKVAAYIKNHKVKLICLFSNGFTFFAIVEFLVNYLNYYTVKQQ